MPEINLLRGLPQHRRNVAARAHAKTDEHIRISRQYGELYFDGPREYGYARAARIVVSLSCTKIGT